MIVQIYEIQTPEEALDMIELGVDHIGSVLVSAEEWRDDTFKQVVDTVQGAGCKSSLIPLFRDPERIVKALSYYRPDIVHFCESLYLDARGNGTVRSALERQTFIRRHFPDIEIMRTIPVGADAECDRRAVLEMASVFAPVSDWFLTDTVLRAGDEQDQPVNGFVGITGRTCNWSVVRDLVRENAVPVILAGGIGPDNVERAILKVHPAGVDSCTRTNAVDANGRTIRFKKDADKVAAMVKAARQLKPPNQ